MKVRTVRILMKWGLVLSLVLLAGLVWDHFWNDGRQQLLWIMAQTAVLGSQLLLWINDNEEGDLSWKERHHRPADATVYGRRDGS